MASITRWRSGLAARIGIPFKTAEVKRAVWVRDGGRCRHCGMSDDRAVQTYGEHLHYDHIVPFSQNGADTEQNCQLLCRGCDLAKGNRFAG